MTDKFNMEVADINQRVLKNMNRKLAWHEMLAQYTKKTVALNKHLCNISIMKEVIADYKEEYKVGETNA